MICSIKTKRSTVHIDPDMGIVIKKPIRWAGMVFHREIGWLKKFAGSDRFPKVIDSDENQYWIKLNYCGEQISKANCPYDWETQMNDILLELKQHGCSHNDIKPDEILVKDGQMVLVDFGWATQIGEPISPDWPPNLGGDFRLQIHNFDDEYSFRKSIGYILDVGAGNEK